MELIFIKIFSVVSLVLSLSIIAEKLSPKLSGILSGLPVGSSITLLFFAIENGVEYTNSVALYNIHGLFAALAFSYGYYLSTFYKGKFEIFLSLMVSFFSYIFIALFLSLITPHIIFTPLVVIILIISSSIYFAKKENFKINKSVKTSLSDIIFRSLLTIFIFLIVTSLPKIAPANIAGIFSAFPTILLPLLLIIHLRHSNLQARTIIKNTPFGLSSVVIYSLIVYFSYSSIGMFWGTLIALLSSILYVIIQSKILKYFKLIP